MKDKSKNRLNPINIRQFINNILGFKFIKFEPKQPEKSSMSAAMLNANLANRTIRKYKMKMMEFQKSPFETPLKVDDKTAQSITKETCKKLGV